MRRNGQLGQYDCAVSDVTDGAIRPLLTADRASWRTPPRKNWSAAVDRHHRPEPQAGSVWPPCATRAEPQTDGCYKVFGTKIYSITTTANTRHGTSSIWCWLVPV
jgi:hypothetical protein